MLLILYLTASTLPTTTQIVLKSTYGTNISKDFLWSWENKGNLACELMVASNFIFSEWLNQWRSQCMRLLLDGDSSRIWWTPDDALCVEKRALALVGWVGLCVTGESSCSSANPLETCKSFCASKAGEELLRDQRNKQKQTNKTQRNPLGCVYGHIHPFGCH